MIFSESKVWISDNSGGKWAKCIKSLKSSPFKGASLPTTKLVVSVRRIRANKNNVMKGKMYKALLIRVKKNFTRINGISISFNLNTIILLNERSLPLASRVIGPVYKEFRSKYSSKILLLSTIGI